MKALGYKYDTKPQQEKPEELQKLEVFVGEWKLKGHSMSGSHIDTNTVVNGVETYEWMPGKYFLINKWDTQGGIGEHTGMGVICYDEVRKEFTANNYDSMGVARVYHLTLDGRVWRFTG